MQRLARTALFLTLSLALLYPAWAADNNTPVLNVQDGRGGVQLTLQNLGQRTVHSIQLELTIDGAGPHASFSPSDSSWYSHCSVEEREKGQTCVTVYIDSHKTINLNGTVSLGTLNLGGSYPAPKSAGLIMLDHRLEAGIGQDGAVSIPVQTGSTGQPDDTSSSGGSSSDGSYRVSVPSRVTGGSVTVRPSSASPGSRVTITAKPNVGYEVETVAVTDQAGKPVAVTEGTDGTYTFIMPNSKVDVTVEFVRTQTASGHISFTDVPSGAWYYSAVNYVQEHGLMNGVGNGLFDPDSNLSRAQLAQILYNAAGNPASAQSSFDDVPPGQWYSNAVGWASQNHIVSGYGNGTFGPNDKITREQLAVMLWRYTGQPVPQEHTLQFSDASQVSDYAVEAISWAIENGILSGYGQGVLAPRGLATRAQVASMLMRYMS